MKKSLFFILTLGMFLLFSCKEDPPPPQKTKTELLTQGTWKFSSATANGADASGYLQACQRDNIYAFLVAGTGTVDEGPTKCNAGDPQTVPFTWNFATNETVIHVSTSLFSGTSNDMTIETLTETQLIVTFPYIPPVGPAVMIRAIFTH